MSNANPNELFRQKLREAGLRATPARVSILRLLATTRGPVSHQEASDQLESAGVDKSTVFRALQDLAQANLVRKLELGDHVWRYEAASAKTRSSTHALQAHPHLLCVDCGSITCLADDEVQLNVSRKLGTIEDVLLKGHCSQCQDPK